MNHLIPTELRKQIITLKPCVTITFNGGGVRLNRPLMNQLGVNKKNADDIGVGFSIKGNNLYISQLEISKGGWHVYVNKQYGSGFFSSRGLMTAILQNLKIYKNNHSRISFEVFDEEIHEEGRTFFQCSKPLYKKANQS